MRVLLLNPPGPFCRAGSRWPHRRRTQSTGIDYHPFPFSLAYAAARLKTDGHKPFLLDCVALDMDLSALLKEVARIRPDVVFIETGAPSFSDDVETMRVLDRPAIAGGAHATATPDEHLAEGFSAVIRGEYDQVISQAVLFNNYPWLAMEGKSADHAPLATDLDSIPAPLWSDMPMEKYNDPFCKGRSVTVLSSRGCPHHCGFCTVAPYYGCAGFRTRNSESVCNEIAELIALYRPDEIYFDDDTITAKRSHILALCDEYAHRNFKLPFSCMGDAVVERSVLEAMARAGCRAYKFGVETGDPDVMKRIPKRIDLDQVTRTVRDCRALGIKTHATFLLGLPGENRERALRTIDFALHLHTHTLQFAIATPYPGTDFYNEAMRNEWLTCEDWRSFDPATEAVVSYPDYTSEEIREMHEMAWKKWQLVMLKRPATLIHHFSNAYRREGIRGFIRLGKYGVKRLLDMSGST